MTPRSGKNSRKRFCLSPDDTGTTGPLSGGALPHSGHGHPVDLVFENGVVFTADSRDTLAECLAVKDGRIVFVGSAADGAAYKGPDTETVDLAGGMLLPGLMDTHVHAPGTLLTELNDIDLAGIGDLAGTLAAIESFIREHPERDIYFGEGYNTTAFTEGEELRKGPSGARLDAIERDKPVILTAYDKHSLWVNSAALEKFGVTAQTSVPPGGVIEMDEATGRPWGTLKEFAMDLIPRRRYDEDQIYRAFLAFQRRMHGWGYTAVNAMSAFDEDNYWRIYKKMHDRGELTLRVHTAYTVLPGLDLNEQLRAIQRLREAHDCPGARLTIAKYFVDGVVDGRTACLAEPYAHDPGARGEPLWETEALAEALARTSRAGLQNHVHCIGDAALSAALDAFARARAKLPDGDYRDAVVHLCLCDPGDLPRLAELNLVASVQPYWIGKYPQYWETVEAPFLGHRAERMYPLKSLLEAGVVVASSSDSPVTPYAYPFVAIEAGVTRNITEGCAGPEYALRHMDDGPHVLWPEERVSVADMIRSFSINNAFLTFRDHFTGSLEPGKAADLVVIDKNILAINPVEIETVRVLRTYVDGHLVNG